MEYQQLQDEIKAAMKARDNHRRDILRQVHTELKAIEVNERRGDRGRRDAMLKRAPSSRRRRRWTALHQSRQQPGSTDTLTEQVAILEEYLPAKWKATSWQRLSMRCSPDTGASTKDMGPRHGRAHQAHRRQLRQGSRRQGSSAVSWASGQLAERSCDLKGLPQLGGLSSSK